MTVHTLTATATDTMSASANDTVTINSTASAPQRKVRRSFFENRIMWGWANDNSPKGPSFSDVTETGYTYYVRFQPITLSVVFSVERECMLTGCRIYKAPNATGTDIPIKVWTGLKADVAVDLGTVATIPSWTVDGGGWRQINFPTPLALVPGETYSLGYFSGDGIYAYTNYVWHGQDTCVWPLYNKMYIEAGSGNTGGSAIWFGTPDIGYPTNHRPDNFYIDPQVEWDEPLPGYDGGTSYWDQWTGPKSRHAFPVCVFYSDPQYLAGPLGYYAMGVNTLMAGYLGGDGQYIVEMNRLGNAMDWIPAFDPADPATILRIMAENPAIAASIIGWQLDDEPDLTAPYRSPTTVQGWRNAMKRFDSTRPIYLGFGRPSIRNQGYNAMPQGATRLLANEYWRDWAALGDWIGGDDYAWFEDNDPAGWFGPWSYAAQIGRMRDISDSAKPIWGIVETTSQIGPTVPTPEQVRKSVWAMIIAGARGIILFDHRFGSDFVSQDFAHMLHNPPMKSMMSTLITRLQSIGPALLAKDLGLITGYTSSNTTAGPLGGTWGVPLHYTTRTAGAYQYAIVQAIRAGTTTATITIPSWSGQTVTVLDESRTETVSGAGVITDDFTDYAVHIYRRTL